MKNKGFTLIEITVVVAIMILLSGIVLVDYRTGAKQLSLERSSHKLAQDIRRAQGMAVSTKELSGGTIPSGGYGINFNRNVANNDYDIVLYADTAPPGEGYNSDDEIIETLFLEKDVKIKDVKLKKPGSEPSPDGISVNFKPPDPIVSLKSGAGDVFEEVEITLALKTDDNKTKKIIVNKVGLIYVSQ